MDLMQIITKERYNVINIYAPNHYKEKEQCWATIKEALKEIQSENNSRRRFKFGKKHRRKVWRNIPH